MGKSQRSQPQMASKGAIYGETLRSFTFGSLVKVISRYLLDDFILTLKTVRGAIEQLLTKVSEEAVVDLEDEMLDVNNGFGEPDEDDTQGNAPTFSRPQGVTDRDWRVYEVLDGVLIELQRKFKATWA